MHEGRRQCWCETEDGSLYEERRGQVRARGGHKERGPSCTCAFLGWSQGDAGGASVVGVDVKSTDHRL